MSVPNCETSTFHMIEAVAGLEGAPRQLADAARTSSKSPSCDRGAGAGASVSAIARRVGIHPLQLFAWA